MRISELDFDFGRLGVLKIGDRVVLLWTEH